MTSNVDISHLKMGEDALSELEKRIAGNADALIAEGKAAWLKQRKASHKNTMDDKQQEYQLAHIERKRLEQIENGHY